MAESKNPFLNSAILLTAATAFLYCVSTAHYGGYLGPLHLDADILDRNFHQVLYNGFLISFGPMFWFLAGYGLMRLFYSHFVLPEIIDWLRHGISRRRRFLKFRHRWFGKRKDSLYEKNQKQHAIRALLYVALALALIASLVYFESLGKRAARKMQDRLEAEQIATANLVQVKINDDTKNLFYLACGARNCAGIELKTRKIYYFPQNGHSYQHQAVPAERKDLTGMQVPPASQELLSPAETSGQVESGTQPKSSISAGTR